MAHDDEIREQARQIWTWQAGRDAKRTAAILSSEHDIEVNERSIQRWVANERWPQRAAEDLRQLAPGLREAAAAELIAGSLESARYLRAVINAADVLPPDAKVRVTAAQLLLDRAGFSPVGSRDPVAAPTKVDARRGVLRWLSEEDIKKIEEGG